MPLSRAAIAASKRAFTARESGTADRTAGAPADDPADDLPVPVATVTVPGNGEALFRIRLLDAAPEATHAVWLRVRDREDTPAHQMRSRRVEVRGTDPSLVVLGLEFASGDRFQDQLGLELEAGERPLYGRWTTTGPSQ